MDLGRKPSKAVSYTQQTINKATVRIDNGKLLLWQCNPRLHTSSAVSRNIATQPTVGDILNKRKQQKSLYTIVLGNK